MHIVMRASRQGALIAAASVLAASPAASQAYPTRPITLVVGFTAGGPTDIPARFIAARLATSLGTPVVVENKPGAGSMLATYDVLAAPRDGHRLLVCTYFDPVNTLLYKNARYKVSDLAPVTLIVKYDYAIAVRTDMPIKTFGDLVQFAKANPGKLNYGQLGIGSTQNILAKSLEKLTGMKMTAVTFKGAADATQEVVAGRIDLFIGPPFVVLPQYDAKKINVAAVTGTDAHTHRARRTDALGKRHPPRSVCVARHLRWFRNTAAHHRSVEQGVWGRRPVQGLSRAD